MGCHLHSSLFILTLSTVLALLGTECYTSALNSEAWLRVLDLEDAIEDAMKPDCNVEENVRIILYKKNSKTPEYMHPSNASSTSSFNPENQTRIIVHGWNSGPEQFEQMKNAYLDCVKDVNVMVVDWHRIASREYSIAKKCSRSVGEYIAYFLLILVKWRCQNLADMHIIGHSLGAHCVGVTGNRLDGQVGRIVGLDAAAPLFGTTKKTNRLDSSDAKVVQGIHTNGGLLAWYDPYGHIDIYPNGGSFQKGCGLDISGVCSHNRAVLYYTESICSQKFAATQCRSYENYEEGKCRNNIHIPMGEWAPLNATGNFFLKTNENSPYAQGNTSL